MSTREEAKEPRYHGQKRGRESNSYQKKKGRRLKGPKERKLTLQLGARISMEMFGWLLDIGSYEGVGYTEIARLFLHEGIARYRQDKFFQEFMQKKKEKQQSDKLL